MNRIEIITEGMLSMQVCADKDATDEEIITFVNMPIHQPGTTTGWVMRRTGDPNLAGQPERVVCASDPGRVHIMFDC